MKRARGIVGVVDLEKEGPAQIRTQKPASRALWAPCWNRGCIRCEPRVQESGCIAGIRAGTMDTSDASDDASDASDTSDASHRFCVARVCRIGTACGVERALERGRMDV